MSVTERQLKLFLFIRNYITHNRKTPSFREMRQEMRVHSNQAILDWLAILEKKDYIIRKKYRFQSIDIDNKHNTINRAFTAETEFRQLNEKIYRDVSPNDISAPVVTNVGVYNTQTNNFGNNITLQVGNNLLLRRGGEKEGTT